MAKRTIKLPSMSSVVAGSTAVLDLPIGPTYKRILFTASGTGLDVTDIARINVLINGKVVQTFKNLQRLFDLNSYYKRAADAVTQFALHFERKEMHNLGWRRMAGIGTADIATFSVQLELVAGAPANIAMSAHAEVDTVPQALGAFVRVREFPISSNSSGQVEWSQAPRGPLYLASHIFKADVSAIELERNGVKIVEGTKAVLERLAKEASPVERVPVTASCTHIDHVLEGDLGQAVDTSRASDWRYKMTWDTSGSAEIVTETLENVI